MSVRLRGFEYIVTVDTLAEAYYILNFGSRVAKKEDIINIKGYNELAFKREVFGNPKVKEGNGFKSNPLRWNTTTEF